MDGVCGTYGGKKKCTQNCCKKTPRIKSLRRPKPKQDDNIKINTKETGFLHADKFNNSE